MNKLFAHHILSICLIMQITIGCKETEVMRNTMGPVQLQLTQGWTFHADSIGAQSYPAEVPGTFHTDLMKANLISDPFYKNNEIGLRPLEDVTWVYTTTFNISPEQIEYDRIELIFDGLDTYTDITINGKKLGRTDNMFRQWKFDVKPFVKKNENELTLTFIPPKIKNRQKAQGLGYILPADNEEEAIKISPFTRKAPYHFGWDWGPRLVTAGIWKPVYLEFWNGIKIEHASIETISISDKRADMRAVLNIRSALPEAAVTIHIGDKNMECTLSRGDTTLSIPFMVMKPKLWWPNGSGAAHQYTNNITIIHNGHIADWEKVRYGIRTLELVNEVDSIGAAFYFKVNGKPLFMQGANYIPQDVFIPRVSNKQYSDLLTAARDANMNMIRVWGGGIYEQDIFYDLCDSLGLLVWQDFMFAGTMYPGDDEFVNTVKQEITQQVQRLKKHPSLALFCGNNEMEVAWYNWGWQDKYGYSDSDSTEIWNNYLRLFRNIIPSIVSEVAPHIPYTSTSPLSNWGTPENFNHGSMHYWGVWHGRNSFESYKSNVGRFMVEYGMQSYPELSTINKFAEPEDFSLQSSVMKNRQKSYIGNAEILKHVREHFHEPTSFEEFVSLSQEAQAKAMEIAIHAHKNSNGHCMGTMLWQLNDCWPGPSWSIIDYYGNKKKAYYAVKEQMSE